MWQALMQCCTKRPGNFLQDAAHGAVRRSNALFDLGKARICPALIPGRTVKIEVDTHGSRRQIRIGKNMARDQRKAAFKFEVADVNVFVVHELLLALQISVGTALLDIAGFNQLGNGITHGFFAAA